MDTTALLPQPIPTEITNNGRIILGDGYGMAASAPAEVADTGRIKVGSCGRFPADGSIA